MKILSWNVWVDCNFRKIKEFLSVANTDVIGLQEVKDNDPGRNAIDFLTKLGYQCVFACTE